MNQLTTYSSDIKRLHLKAQQHAASAIQCAMEAGQLLIEAKSSVKHGGWLPFVESTGVNERTARNYMHLARNQDLLKSATVADMGVKKALEYLAEKKPPLEAGSSAPSDGEYLEFVCKNYFEFVWPHGSGGYLYINARPHYQNGEAMGYPIVYTPGTPIQWDAVMRRIHNTEKMTRKTGSPLFALLMLRSCLSQYPDDTLLMRDQGYCVMGLDFSGIEVRHA